MLMENETLSVEKLLVRAVQYTHLFHIIQCKYMWNAYDDVSLNLIEFIVNIHSYD